MDPHTDPRRGLGIRPGPLPVLKLSLDNHNDTNDEVTYNDRPHLSPDPSPSERRFPTLRDLSLPIPSGRRESVSPTSPRSPSVGDFQARLRRATLRPKPVVPEPPRGLYETQKLLSHLLDRLEERNVPPDILERTASQARALHQAQSAQGKSLVQRQLGQPVVGVAQCGIGADQGGIMGKVSMSSATGSHVPSGRGLELEWSHDETFGLIVQLRDLLMLSRKQGLDILRSPVGSSSVLDTSSRLLVLLRQFSYADNLYTISDFSPISPPIALQTIWLDIATILFDKATSAHRLDIVEVVVAAFSTASEGMAERLYAWLSLRFGDMVNQAEHPGLSKRVKAVAIGADGPYPRLQAIYQNTWTALCTRMDLDSTSLTGIFYTHQMIRTLLTTSPCPAHDLLRVAAYAPASARRIAISLLSTYFPASMGHNIIARRPPTLTYDARRNKWETGQDRAYGEDDTENHHYIHWRISSKDGLDPIGTSCTVCEGEIHGFCVRCTMCKDALHLNCYQTAQGMFRYDVVDTDDSSTYTVVVKFARTLTSLEERLSSGTTISTSNSENHQKLGEHDLHRVHLFTSTPCQACRKPIWADPSSVFACFSGCQALFHTDCIKDSPRTVDRICQTRRIWPVSHFETTMELGRRSVTRLHGLVVNQTNLAEYGYDQVAILYGALYIRYQTLKNGITGRSVCFPSSESESDPLSIRPVLRRYEEFLLGNAAAAYSAAADFAYISGAPVPIGQSYLFSDRYHEYITALLKSPGSPSTANIEGSAVDVPTNTETCSMSLASTRITLAADLQIHQDLPAEILVRHLETEGYVRAEQTDRGSTLHFDLPFGIEQTQGVNTLIDYIAASLEVLDLAMNEQAMIMLTTQAWPSLLCSPYNLERLGGAVVRWVIAEDDVLHTLVREYASKHRRLPGVRTVPGASSSRTSGSVQQYQEARNSILRQYAQPWLETLHRQDPELYKHILYEQCKSPLPARTALAADDTGLDASAIADLALDRLMSMLDSAITFSCLLDLITLWLEDLGALADEAIVFKSLPRLLSRHSSPAPGSTDPSDIFSLATETASDSEIGLLRACMWIRVLAFSGVAVPWQTVKTLIRLSRQAGWEMRSRLDLVITIDTNIACSESAEYANLCGSFLVDHVQESERRMAIAIPTESNDDYIKKLLALVLRAHGVDEQHLRASTLGPGDKAHKNDGNAAKAHRTAVSPGQTIRIDEAVILATARMLQLRTYPIPVLLECLWLLFAQAKQTLNIDETIFSLAQPLYKVLWPLLDLDEGSTSLLQILLRLISTHPEPFEQMLQAEVKSPSRNMAVQRLTKFVIQLTDDRATASCRNWRSGVVKPLLLFFSAISDPARLEPANMAIREGMLPLHLVSLSRCFEEYLVSSSDERRLDLLVKLRKLRLSFTSWPVISWDTIDTLITECVITMRQSAAGKASQNHLGLLDSQNLRCNLIALGLDMLATGIPIQWSVAQRFQQHVAAQCEVPWFEPSGGMEQTVLPSLRDVLDSSAQLVISSEQIIEGKKPKSTPVGVLFVPIVISIAGALMQLDLLSQRCVLDILIIVFHKHDTTVVQFAAVDALQSVAVFIERAECADNRILALAVVQAALDRCRREHLVRVMPAVFLSLAKCMVGPGHISSHSMITDQSAILLKRIIKGFGGAGLLLDVIQLDGAIIDRGDTASIPSEAVLQLYPVLTASMEQTKASQVVHLFLSDLPDIFKRGRQALEHFLAGLSRAIPIMCVVMNVEAIEAFGAFISRLGKHIGEWDPSEFDPDHALRSILPVLQELGELQAIPFLSQVATFLQLCLSRFNVGSDTLLALLAASSKSCARLQVDDMLHTVTYSAAAAAIDGLAVTPNTLATLLNFCIRLQDEQRVPDGFDDSSGGLVRILCRRHPTLNTPRCSSSTNRIILSRSSTLLLRLELRTSGSLPSALASLPSESVHTQLDVFISVLLASTELTPGRTHKRLLDLFPVLARAVAVALRGIADLLVVQDAAEEGAKLISAVLSAVRLAFLAGVEPDLQGSDGEYQELSADSPTDGFPDSVLEAFWMRISPEWYRLIYLSLDPSCANAPLKAVVHSVFLDTIISVSRFWPTLPMTHGNDIWAILDVLGEATISGGRLQRAKDALDARVISTRRLGAGEKKRILDAINREVQATQRRR